MLAHTQPVSVSIPPRSTARPWRLPLGVGAHPARQRSASRTNMSAFNPRRADRHLGSFQINVRTGKWADFATGDRGGDLISLGVAYQPSQVDDARAASPRPLSAPVNLHDHKFDPFPLMRSRLPRLPPSSKAADELVPTIPPDDAPRRPTGCACSGARLSRIEAYRRERQTPLACLHIDRGKGTGRRLRTSCPHVGLKARDGASKHWPSPRPLLQPP